MWGPFGGRFIFGYGVLADSRNRVIFWSFMTALQRMKYTFEGSPSLCLGRNTSSGIPYELLKSIFLGVELLDGCDGVFSSKWVSCSPWDHAGVIHKWPQKSRLLATTTTVLFSNCENCTNFDCSTLSMHPGGNICHFWSGKRCHSCSWAAATSSPPTQMRASLRYMPLSLTSRKLLKVKKIKMMGWIKCGWSFACIWAINRGGVGMTGILGDIQGRYISIEMTKKIGSDFNSDATSAFARAQLAREVHALGL